MIVRLERRTLWAALGAVVVFFLVLLFSRRVPQYIPAEAVWQEAVALGEKHELAPRLLFAIAFAESSLNANADSGYARGLMQVSADAWAESTSAPYRNAFQWRRNMEVASVYLAYLRDRLVEDGQYDGRHLAAAYRYGYAALAEKKFAVNQLPKPNNEIYQEIFRGRLIDPVKYGVPRGLLAAAEGN